MGFDDLFDFSDLKIQDEYLKIKIFLLPFKAAMCTKSEVPGSNSWVDIRKWNSGLFYFSSSKSPIKRYLLRLKLIDWEVLQKMPGNSNDLFDCSDLKSKIATWKSVGFCPLPQLWCKPYLNFDKLNSFGNNIQKWLNNLFDLCDLEILDGHL